MKSLLNYFKVISTLIIFLNINHHIFSQNANTARLVNKTFQVDVSIDDGKVNVRIKYHRQVDKGFIHAGFTSLNVRADYGKMIKKST